MNNILEVRCMQHVSGCNTSSVDSGMQEPRTDNMGSSAEEGAYRKEDTGNFGACQCPIRWAVGKKATSQ